MYVSAPASHWQASKAAAPPLTQQLLSHLAEQGLTPGALFVEEGRAEEVFRMVTTGAEQ